MCRPVRTRGGLEGFGAALGTVVTQPRPVLGRFPWLAFFLDRSLRLTVFLDMTAQAIGPGRTSE